MKKTVTVFTPTYNRAYLLPRLYESLCRQTSQDFEWLIVDDGSTDNTEDLIQGWIDEHRILIRYYFQVNGGKQRAHNLGVTKCESELFICVDSDDYITDGCIEQHIKKWKLVKDKKNIAGIISLKGGVDKNPLGSSFPPNVKYTTTSDLYGKYKFRGDATMVYRTDILKEHPFWVAEGEKFIGEGYVYSQIDQRYLMAALPEILMICEYLEDGYSKNVRKLTKDNPKSYMTLKRQTIIYAKTWRERYIQTILYMVGGILAREKHLIGKAPYRVLSFFAFIPAYIIWFLIYKNA